MACAKKGLRCRAIFVIARNLTFRAWRHYIFSASTSNMPLAVWKKGANGERVVFIRTWSISWEKPSQRCSFSISISAVYIELLKPRSKPERYCARVNVCKSTHNMREAHSWEPGRKRTRQYKSFQQWNKPAQWNHLTTAEDDFLMVVFIIFATASPIPKSICKPILIF